MPYNSPELCRDSLRGLCFRQNCYYVHDSTQRRCDPKSDPSGTWVGPNRRPQSSTSSSANASSIRGPISQPGRTLKNTPSFQSGSHPASRPLIHPVSTTSNQSSKTSSDDDYQSSHLGLAAERLPSSGISYSSTTPPSAPSKICWADERGRCPRGSNCPYAHTRASGSNQINRNNRQSLPSVHHRTNAHYQNSHIGPKFRGNFLSDRTNHSSTPYNENLPPLKSRQPHLPVRFPPITSTQPKDPFNSRSHATPYRDPLPRYQKTVLASTRVVFGSGATIQEIDTAFESHQVIITGLPSSIQEGQLISILEAFGKPKTVNITPDIDGELAVAHARFSDCGEASKAAAGLHATTLMSHRLAARLDLCTAATGAIRRNTVQVSWYPPSLSARAIFDSPETARLRARDLHASSYGGRRLTAYLETHSLVPVPRRRSPLSIIIKGLPMDTEMSALRTFCMAVHVTTWESGYNLPESYDRIRDLLEKFGEVQFFDVTHSDEYIVRAMARFQNPDSAERAISTLNFTCPLFLDGRCIRLRPIHTVCYTLTVRQYVAQYDDFLAVRQLKDKQVSMKVKEYDTRVVIFLHSRDAKALVRFKSNVEKLTNGEKVEQDGVALWDDYFKTETGAQFIQRIYLTTKAFVRCDSRKRTLTLYGPPTRKMHAKLMIQQELCRLQGQLHIIALRREALRYFCIRGLARLQKELGHENVTLDVTACRISVRGGAEALKKLNLTIEASLADLSVNASPSSTTCPVCLGHVLDPSLLPCGHAYCTPCLRHLINSGAVSKIFPLACLEEDCKSKIPLHIMQKLLSNAEFDSLLDASFFSYIQERPNEFHYCPTADCPQIYRPVPESEPTILQCPSCLIRICPSCHVESHDGFTCKQFRDSTAQREDERLFLEWKKSHDVKPCPICHADLEKDDGCNHLTCTRCKTHICWACMATFNDGGGGVYEHMQHAHGGIGVPVDYEYVDD